MNNLNSKNMFKHRLKNVLSLLLICGFVTLSCEDQLLNREPKSELTTANFYNSASQVDGAVLGVYSSLQSRWDRDFVIHEVAADNAYAEYYALTDGMDQIELLDISDDNDEINNFWQDTYNGIFRANVVLGNIDNPDNYSGNQREQYEGEAKFMRAYFYFDLVRMFGGVPEITSSQLSIQESKEIPRASEQEIYDLILSDLTDAVNMLPNPTETVHGRASSAAAEALLGKVYIYGENYTAARPYLESVLNEYNFELVDDYGDLFNIETEENSEAIFSLAYTTNNGHSLSSIFNPNEGLFGYTSRGSRVIRPTWDLHQQFHEDDSRFEETIMEEIIPWNGSADDDPDWFPIFSKFLVPDLGANDSGLDIPVIRLADVILLYSEVLYELEETEAALTQINRVRERAFGDDSQNYTLSDIGTRDNFIDVLLQERRLEFVLENKRWFDITRTGRLIDILGGELEGRYNPSTGTAEMQQINAQEYMRYFPIPREQINLASPGVLEQNDGY